MTRCDEKFIEFFKDATFQDESAITAWREAWRIRTEDICNQLSVKLHFMEKETNETNEQV